MKYANWEVANQGIAVPDRVPELVGRVLAARGVVGEDAVQAFLRTDAGLLRDALQLKDLPAAADRLDRAIAAGETIAVYGDYDVDGVTATCLLTHFFRARGAQVLCYIPRRLEEGYGLNRTGLETLRDQGAQVVVTVDCGITAVDEVEYAKELGLEVIITDHHACKDVLPAAVAVVDPHRPDCPYPFKGLAGVGVALKLAMAMGAALEDYADLAALGTVADVMPLLDENRAIVAAGLEKINTAPRPGIQALLAAAQAADRATAVTLGYTLAPRLNAAGRLGVTQIALDLLLSSDAASAEVLAGELCELNRRRQTLEGEIFAQCVGRVEEEAAGDAAIVLHGEGWHQGVVGIVASRLAERFLKPTFMISVSDGMGKGSCRGVGELSLFDALQSVSGLLEGFGGHAMAAGFTVKAENIPALRRRLNAWVADRGGAAGESSLSVDVALPDGALLTEEQVAALELLEPFGSGNPKPVFLLPRVQLSGLSRVGTEGKHMRMTLQSCAQRFSAIFFSCPRDGWDGLEDGPVDVAFTPQINEFRGRRSVQLVVQDLRPAQADEGELAYRKYRAGQALTAREAVRLIPSRAQFELLWRQVRRQAPVTMAPVEHLADRLDPWLTLVGLEVFCERGLIDFAAQRTQVSVALRPRGDKVDLDRSPVLIRLRAFVEEGA